MPGTSGPDHMFPNQQTTQYQVAVPTEDWEAWKDEIPRSMPLYERLYTLIQIDTTLSGEADVASLNLLRIKLERIQQRAETAEHALDDDNLPKVRGELDDIQTLVEDLL